MNATYLIESLQQRAQSLRGCKSKTAIAWQNQINQQGTQNTPSPSLKIMTEKPDIASNTESFTEVTLLLNKLVLHKNNALMLLPF